LGGNSGRADELRINCGERGTLPIAARAVDASLHSFLIDGSWILYAAFGVLDGGSAALSMKFARGSTPEFSDLI